MRDTQIEGAPCFWKGEAFKGGHSAGEGRIKGGTMGGRVSDSRLRGSWVWQIEGSTLQKEGEHIEMGTLLEGDIQEGTLAGDDNCRESFCEGVTLVGGSLLINK